MDFHDFDKDQPDGNPYAHADFDLGFKWNAKDDANDKDNGFICKRPINGWSPQNTAVLFYSIFMFFLWLSK